MLFRRSLAILPLAGVVLLAAACGSSDPYGAPAAGPTAATSSSASPSAKTPEAVTELKTGTTALGRVVTDGKGMTLYLFTKDALGGATSACTGACLTSWPPAVTASSTPTLTGVSGALATIDTVDGRKQLTLGGWPLYYFAKDAKPGDVKGQGVGSVWFVLDKAGVAIKG